MGISESRWKQLTQDLAGFDRYTQDTPLLPDVWWKFAQGTEARQVLLTPHRSHTPGDLAKALRQAGLHVIYNQSTVAAKLTLDELVTVVLPFSRWWRRAIAPQLSTLQHANDVDVLADLEPPTPVPRTQLDRRFLWFVRMLGNVALAPKAQRDPAPRAVLKKARSLLGGIDPRVGGQDLLFSVALDRNATVSTVDSVPTVKADAARRLFDLSCAHLTWAVLDSGIDRDHPAFRAKEPEPEPTPAKKKRKKTRSKKLATKKALERGPAEPPPTRSRVKETYDFTRLRQLLTLASSPNEADREALQKEFGLDVADAREMTEAIARGRDVDWSRIAGTLRVEKIDPLHPHGTHVAGIIGGKKVDGQADSADGVCPDIRLIDLRVLDSKGTGREFEIIAALQFIRYLNAHKEKPIIHGANLSLSIAHDARNYACGRTPVCDECDRLVASGVVTVAAAGNLGIEQTAGAASTQQGAYRDITITDPGNTESVVTVGATHRREPHNYGVSFFSSRGPTGDGRLKPDIVAPGEKIVAPVPNGRYAAMDGTSMAAPHVSGAAALLLARHPEFIGQPANVKRILCETATDLRRERYFQGHGLLDILRALQSV